MKLIQRYSKSERFNHWFVALCFITLALSGLGFLFPSYFWLTGIFGTPQLARILHPLLGVIMALAFAVQFLRYWRHNLIDAQDVKWLKSIPKIAQNQEAGEVGKYNGGQKVLFWTLSTCVLVLLLTGIIAWRPYFAEHFSIPLIRLALLLHSTAAVVMICSIIVHIYAAIWINGTIRAMLEGYVTHTWAKKHHPRWYREITAKSDTGDHA